ncbi:MAG: pyroglutamyl-peptidase I [Rubrivivax sp.]|nr:MAG: pyroglutamyl-peptidase I [Rubrivivax sp.]
MTILLTGFEPFGGEPINPSWEVARALHGQRIGDTIIQARCLPTSFNGAPLALAEALAAVRPRLVIALGQASGRSEISIERVALNLIDARIADNLGHRPQDVPVRAGAAAAYFTTLPVKAMRDALRAAGHPAGLSLSAGAFVCNQVFFELQHCLAGEPARSGFIHLPALPEQAARSQPSVPSMSLSAQVDAIRLAVTVALTVEGDLPTAGDEGAPVS